MDEEKVYIPKQTEKGVEIICVEGTKHRFVAFINESMYPGLADEVVETFNIAAHKLHITLNPAV